MTARCRPAPIAKLTSLLAHKAIGARVCPHCGGVLSNRMTATEQLEAINLYIEGETLQELSIKFNRDVTTIRRLMARNGIRKQPFRNRRK